MNVLENRSLRRDVLAVLGVVIALKAAGLMGMWVSAQQQRDFTSRYGGFLFEDGMTKQARLKEISASFAERLAPYDGQWYLRIGKSGYKFEAETPYDGNQASYAFFPLFPLVASGVGTLTGFGTLTAGLLLNQLLTVVAGLLLYFIVRPKFGHWAGLAAVTAFCVYPSFGFANMFYAEPLFIVLLLGHVVLAQRQRSGWAALVGLALGLCRPQGCLALFWHIGAFLEGRSLSLRNAAVAASAPFGFCIFWAYVWSKTGSMEALFAIQSEWGRAPSVTALFTDASTLLSSASGLLTILCIALSFVTLIAGVFVRPLGLGWLYLGGALLAVPLLTGSTISVPRFLLANIPQFMVLGAAAARWPTVALPALTILGGVSAVVSTIIVDWHWLS